ncbi:hypothetical protein ACW9YV_30485 (plasmid) [Paraburkholderia strydomiana]
MSLKVVKKLKANGSNGACTNAICALQNRDSYPGALPRIETAVGAANAPFQAPSPKFSNRQQPAETRGYNHECAAIRFRLSAACK